MARHRKLAAAEDEDPVLDISSLIDCCFLLLIYFLVATTIVKEKALDMELPGQSPTPNGAQAKIKPGLIVIDKDGKIEWGKDADAIVIDTDVNNHDLPNLLEQLKSLKDTAEAVDEKPVIQLMVEGDTHHQRVMDVINTLSKSGIKSVGLTKPTEE